MSCIQPFDEGTIGYRGGVSTGGVLNLSRTWGSWSVYLCFHCVQGGTTGDVQFLASTPVGEWHFVALAFDDISTWGHSFPAALAELPHPYGVMLNASFPRLTYITSIYAQIALILLKL